MFSQNRKLLLNIYSGLTGKLTSASNEYKALA